MDIAIIGGGITGLTTALALQKAGLNSTVYEQAPQLNEIGAGIWLQPNAMQVLQWLDLDKEVMQAGCRLNKMEITYSNLSPVKKIKQSIVADRQGNQTIAIHRGKLQRILLERLKQVGSIAQGMQYIRHESVGDKIKIHFNGKDLKTDVLLGADGLRSQVRSSMGLPSEYRHSNQICCRGIAKFKLPEELQHEGKEMWGYKRRFGFSQLSEDSVYFFAVFNKEISPEDIHLNSLAELFKKFNPIVERIIKASGDLHTAELIDIKRLPAWHNTHTCLLGDAAHATTPNMGQGACQGIEDAYYITQALAENGRSPMASFSVFENQRRKKVDYIVNNSWRFGSLAHTFTGQLILRIIMKLTPESVMSEQMNKLYDVEGLKYSI